MFDKIYIVTAIIIVTQHCQSKTLPTKSNDSVDEDEIPVISYYHHNIFGPKTYAFGFEVNDKFSGNKQFRDERGYANGTKQGSYGYLHLDGGMMITRFFANREQGYLSQSQYLKTEEEPNWQVNWPYKKPNNQSQESSDSMDAAIFHNDKEKLNLTSILLPVQAIKKDNRIVLNPPELEKQFVNPAVLEVINGEGSLINLPNRTDDSIGIKTINKFIPADFPIVPFQLPHEDFKINLNKSLNAMPIPVLSSTNNTLEKPLTPA